LLKITCAGFLGLSSAILVQFSADCRFWISCVLFFYF